MLYSEGGKPMRRGRGGANHREKKFQLLKMKYELHENGIEERTNERLSAFISGDERRGSHLRRENRSFLEPTRKIIAHLKQS